MNELGRDFQSLATGGSFPGNGPATIVGMGTGGWWNPAAAVVRVFRVCISAVSEIMEEIETFSNIRIPEE
jgi:hypothetical protein